MRYRIVRKNQDGVLSWEGLREKFINSEVVVGLVSEDRTRVSFLTCDWVSAKELGHDTYLLWFTDMRGNRDWSVDPFRDEDEESALKLIEDCADRLAVFDSEEEFVEFARTLHLKISAVDGE